MGAERKIWDAIATDVAEVEAKEAAISAAEEGFSMVPSSLLTLDISLPLPLLKPHITELCRDLFKKWREYDDSRFSVETVSGGITNLLLKVSVREDNGDDVIITVRLYGPNTEYVIDRKRELKAIHYLSTAGFGAELLGIFGNGMVQSFINARTLSPSDMSKPKLVAEIARQLRKFHEVVIPGSKEPQLWNDVLNFLDKASALTFDDTEKQATYNTISFDEIRDAIRELKDLTDLLNAPVVFAHNDLLSGNLMLNDDEGKLYFIDFEYGSYSYRGYDIANHFNEYAGLDCDFSLYPDKDAQYYFFRNYLQPDKPLEMADHSLLINKADHSLHTFVFWTILTIFACVTTLDLFKVPSEELEALYIETNSFRLASHLYWALWGLIQAKMSPIDFDYLGYFFLRFSEYERQKEMCFSMARSYLSCS